MMFYIFQVKKTHDKVLHLNYIIFMRINIKAIDWTHYS